MKLRPFVIIFYGVELVTLASKQGTTQRHRFEPFVKNFVDYDSAVKWAKENVDTFLHSEYPWLPGSKTFDVRSEAEISSEKYLKERMSDEAKQKIHNDLQKVILNYMYEKFEQQYSTVLYFSQKNKTFANASLRHKDSANFMIQAVKRACEKDLGFFSTYYAGDFNSKILSILELYFLDRASEFEKSAGASN